MERYRHELKYFIREQEIPLIESRLKAVMRPDPNAVGGSYNISSLYFDDPDDTCLYDVAAGVDRRRKFRIRIYGHDADRIVLESKAKRNDMTLKKSSLLSKKEATELISGRYLRDVASQDEVKKQLTALMMAQAYRPRTIVEYERVPYVCPYGNVRVTIDMNVRSSMATGGFLDREGGFRPVLPAGVHILEVKYDEYLPSIIYDCLNVFGLQRSSVSKYVLCRRYFVDKGDLI